MGAHGLFREPVRPGIYRLFFPGRRRDHPIIDRLPPAVHPRAGGEHLADAGAKIDGYGSSPRRRGTRPYVGVREDGVRFIPAQAGNTRGRLELADPAPVHPRAGGEHDAGAGDVGEPGRFIPAQAGNTATGAVSFSAPTVHPRAGGEHRGHGEGRGRLDGSSPRRRGTLEQVLIDQARRRFIPAQAGNTRCRRP